FFGAAALVAYGVLRHVEGIGSNLRAGLLAAWGGAAGVAALQCCVLPGMRRRAAVSAHAPRAASPDPGGDPASVEDQEAAYQRAVEVQARVRAALSRTLIFVV